MPVVSFVQKPKKNPLLPQTQAAPSFTGSTDTSAASHYGVNDFGLGNTQPAPTFGTTPHPITGTSNASFVGTSPLTGPNGQTAGTQAPMFTNASTSQDLLNALNSGHVVFGSDAMNTLAGQFVNALGVTGQGPGNGFTWGQPDTGRKKLYVPGGLDLREDAPGQWSAHQEGPSGSAGGGYGAGDGSSNELYVNEIMNRLQALHQPVQDPLQPLYQLMALQRVQNLNGAPYTAGEDAALTAHYMDPLTQARDAALGRNKEQAGARGFLPTSGLSQSLNQGVERDYEKAVAGGANDLAVQAVNEKQRRQDEQLTILSQLLTQNQGARGEDNARAQELLATAGLLPGIDQQSLNALLAASNDNSAGNASQLLNYIASLTQNNTLRTDVNGQNTSYLLGQLVDGLLGGLLK